MAIDYSPVAAGYPGNLGTPDQEQSLRDYGKFLTQGSQEPITHPMQGVAQMVRAMMGGLETNQANQMGAMRNQAVSQDRLKMFSGQAQPGQMSSGAPTTSPIQPTPQVGGMKTGDDYTSRVFQIESNNNPNAVTGKNRGLGQFGPDEEREFGINDSNRGNYATQAAALAQERARNEGPLTKALGRPPTDAEHYFAHQQGIGGAISHFTNPDQPAWVNMYNTAEGRKKGMKWAQDAITGNMTPQMKAQLGTNPDNISSGAFANQWQARYNGGQQPGARAPGPMSDASPVGGPGAQLAMASPVAQPNVIQNLVSPGGTTIPRQTEQNQATQPPAAPPTPPPAPPPQATPPAAPTPANHAFMAQPGGQGSSVPLPPPGAPPAFSAPPGATQQPGAPTPANHAFMAQPGAPGPSATAFQASPGLGANGRTPGMPPATAFQPPPPGIGTTGVPPPSPGPTATDATPAPVTPGQQTAANLPKPGVVTTGGPIPGGPTGSPSQPPPQQQPQQQRQQPQQPQPPLDPRSIFPPLDHNAMMRIMMYGDEETKNQMIKAMNPREIPDASGNIWRYTFDGAPVMIQRGLGQKVPLKLGGGVELEGYVKPNPDTGEPEIVVPRIRQSGEPQNVPGLGGGQQGGQQGGGSPFSGLDQITSWRRQQDALGEAEKERVKVLGASRDDFVKNMEHSRQGLGMVQMMQSSLADPRQMPSMGPLGVPVQEFKKLMNQLFGVDLPGTTNGQVLQKGNTMLSIHVAKELGPRPTQFDFKQILANSPNLEMSPQAARYQLNIIEQQFKQNMELARMASSPEASDVNNWIKMRNDYYDSHPLLSPLTGKPLTDNSMIQNELGAGTGGPPRVTDADSYNKIPKGGQYIHPDGSTRTKQ
jgi:hypothetical protein